MKKLLLSAALAFALATPAAAQHAGWSDTGGSGGGGGSVTVTTSCPSTSSTGATIALTTGTVPASESGSYTATSADCGKVFTITGGPFMLPPISGLPATFGVTVINGNLTNGSNETVETNSNDSPASDILVAGASATSASQSPGESAYYSLNAAGTGWVGTGTAPAPIPQWHPGYISGNFYNFNTQQAVGTGSAQAASTVYCTLQEVHITETLKGMGAYFSTGVASGNVSYAIFAPSNGRPSTLIDYAGPVAAPTAAGPSSASLHNTTDTLSPGDYFFCETQDNTTGIIYTIYSSAFAGASSWVGATAPQSGAAAVMSSPGISCAAASTCGTGFAAWSAGAFTWVSFNNPTWTITGLSTVVPLIEGQAN